MKHYSDNKITWQAAAVLKVNQSCLDKGRFPNGKKLTHQEIQDCKKQVAMAKEVLANYGLIELQLTLF